MFAELRLWIARLLMDHHVAISYKKFPSTNTSDYQNIRKDICSGDILMCSGTAIFSKLIQKATGSCWSHVAFVMRLDEIDRVMVLESVESIGVRVIPLSKYLNNYKNDGKPYEGGLAIARHQAFCNVGTSKKLAKMGQFAADRFGYNYDNGEIAKISARIVQNMLPFSKQEKKALQPDNEYICSEYVWSCFKSVGININHQKSDYIAPADFAKSPEIELQFVLQKP